MDFFNQGIPLGRWFRIQVIIHWTFVIYAAFEIFGVGKADPVTSALLMGLLFATVLLHEFGHALSCKAVGGEAPRIILWPLGGIAFVQPPMNPRAWLITTVCGPLVNVILWPIFYFLSKSLVTQRIGVEGWLYIRDLILSDPGIGFGNELGVAVQISLVLWQINRLLLLFNLIPAYPMDGGRILQELLWFGVGYPRSLMIAGMVGTVAGVGFIVIGLGFESISIPAIHFTLGNPDHTPETMLAVIGFLCCTRSWAIYQQSQQIQSWRKK